MFKEFKECRNVNKETEVTFTQQKFNTVDECCVCYIVIVGVIRIELRNGGFVSEGNFQKLDFVLNISVDI